MARMTQRSAGVLLHPTSLPGPFGIGDLGPGAERWLDWLQSSGCALWQVLPLGPTGYADSPYQSLSSFSVNPLLISPDLLVADGLLPAAAAAGAALPSTDRIDYAAASATKHALLAEAWRRFDTSHHLWAGFAGFIHSEREWLDDDALFMAIKGANDLRPWFSWPAPLRDREPGALAKAAAEHALAIEQHRFGQWLFHRQWSDVRRLASERGIRIVGDLPLYVAHDSSDTWINRHLFDLTDEGALITIGGVPPDYFSATGQRWGNPTYDWDAHRAEGFRWWARRLAATLRLVDIVRLDHFRGIADYWEIPADAPDAITGVWRDGPGLDLFDALTEQLGAIPLIAENLGDLSARANDLLTQLPYPGMKILQFAFDNRPEADQFSIDDIGDDVVAYTGTHDNNTTVGWFSELDDSARRQVLNTLGGDGSDIAERIVRTTWASPARIAVAPMQDLLGLGGDARMNTPGTTDGNWQWRLAADQLRDDVACRVRDLNESFDRSI